MKHADDGTLQDLERLAKKLTFVALDECDPRNWTGNGVPMAEMDARTRGDRAYDKKNAGLTVSLLTKVHALIAIHTPEGKRLAARAASEEEELEDLMERAQKETDAALKRLGVNPVGEQYTGGKERSKH
ncbi:TPA: hypothetical protein ACITN2_004680 [Salmonella enterica subsp. enterica serovar Virchow]